MKMKMRPLIEEVYNIFSNDETLLRLLHYPSKNLLDSPLSSKKDNILNMKDKHKIVDRHIGFTPEVKRIVNNEPICRLLVYPGSRRSFGRNYIASTQNFYVDVFVHHEINDVDMRLSWIVDTVADILSGRYIENIGTVTFVDGDNLTAPDGYFAYQTVFRYGDYQ